MREEKWIRWLGTVAALVVLSILIFNSDVITGAQPDVEEVLLYLALVVLPAFATVFLSAFARFWWTFSLGLWLLFLSVVFCIDEKASPTSVLLVLAAATICITTFLNRACRPKGPGTKV